MYYKYYKPKLLYERPVVLQQAEILLEGDLLYGSGVMDSFMTGGIETASHPVEQKDFATDYFNYVWE